MVAFFSEKTEYFALNANLNLTLNTIPNLTNIYLYYSHNIRQIFLQRLKKLCFSNVLIMLHASPTRSYMTQMRKSVQHDAEFR